MAVATVTDFKVYDEQFWSGYTEIMAQNANVFNEKSAGAIQMISRDILGNYEKSSFLTSISNLVSRRDNTSTSGATSVKPAMDERVGVKLNRKIGPIDYTVDALKKTGLGGDPEALSMWLGQQTAQAVMLDMLNTAIKAVVAAIIQNGASVFFDGSTDKLNTPALIEGLALFGDRANALVAWIMHSRPFFDLMQDQAASGLTNIAGAIFGGAGVATIGRPYGVSDAADLKISTTQYYTLGLVPGAIECAESEERTLVSMWITGNESLQYRIQGEYAFNLALKGYRYNTAGGANPDATALSTGSNWVKYATDNKDTAGVIVKSKQ